jgi:cobyrinic acid a,c-diamide synthase
MKTKTINSFCIAGTDSGVGKTVITLALIRAFVERGFNVQPFKCGPDYIDSEFHSKAANNNSYNLDTWMMGAEQVKKTFKRKIQNVDMGIVEGVMGLFDGAKTDSLEGSTASVADLLDIPIILVVNAKNIAQSIAAVVKGYHTLYPNIKIAGIIANNVGSEGHKNILCDALKKHHLPPLIGAIPKNKAFELSERHLGLTPDLETGKTDEWYSNIAKVIENSIDLNLLLKISQIEKPEFKKPVKHKFHSKLKLGIADDESFHFYYKDNLDLLEDNGFELVTFSPLHDIKLPGDLNAVYFGGGFPEMFAENLSSNKTMINSIKDFAENNGVIFAECGGYMYLVKDFVNSEKEVFPMCNILDGTGKMTNKLQNFGYKEIVLDKNCLFGKDGTTFKGHEFHWSTIELKQSNLNLFLTKRIKEEKWKETGQIYKNVFASYIHLHFLSNPEIVKNMKKIILSTN